MNAIGQQEEYVRHSVAGAEALSGGTVKKSYSYFLISGIIKLAYPVG